MGRIKRLYAWLFISLRRVHFIPQRAPVQVWMILTFTLFVGIVVVMVGLYDLFFLKHRIEVVAHEAPYDHARRIAEAVRAAPGRAAALAYVRSASRLLNARITILDGQNVYVDVEGDRDVDDPDLLAAPEIQAVLDGGEDHAMRTNAAGARVLYVAVNDASTGYTVRLAQPVPPLYTLVRRIEATLLIGMLAALLLALLGSWVASRRVTHPLQAITNTARSISEDRLDEKIDVDTRAAEFQDVAVSLNRMSDRFREKIDELERLAKIQSEFIGNVSHEVRNPIFAVSGYLEALATPVLTPEQQKRYAEKGLANLERLNNLFNDLIEIARLEYREDLIVPGVFDLQELVIEVAEMLRPKAEAKKLRLEVDNPHLMIEADRDRIRQVLINLIDNAIVYTDEGTVRFRFRRRRQKVRIEVVDTGRGIPDNHLERIFERFYRVDPDRSRKSGGTGLGLSIVKQILHAHGEQIHVESTPGRGTRFWFELPYIGEATQVAAT